MAHKLIVVAAFVALACAERPYAGFNLESLFVNPRIVGGVDADKGQFPHQVSLQWGLPPIQTHQHFCGGSILNDRWVLTAGHCINAVPNFGEFLVKAGKHMINTKELNEQTSTVLDSFVHPQYSGGVGPYDIALVKLLTPLELNNAVAAVALPTAGKEHSGDVELSGWGSTSRTLKPVMPKALQTATLPVVDLATCKDALESLLGPSPLHQTNICTGPLNGANSACSGDSGGPLVQQNENNQTEVVGVVSWGIMPCGSKGAPSVYTHVSAFVDWIAKIQDEN